MEDNNSIDIKKLINKMLTIGYPKKKKEDEEEEEIQEKKKEPRTMVSGVRG